MKTIKIFVQFYSVMVFFFITPSTFQAQEFNLVNSESSLKVFGTSSLHDWHINAESKSGKIVFNNLETAQVKACEFKVISESLKSGKGSMDKNTYKALKTDKYKTIDYKLIDAYEVIDKGEGKFYVKTKGNLTISGTTKLIYINFNVDVATSQVALTGQVSFKMTEYGIDPPKALFGTITTGDALTIKFKTVYK